MCSAQGQLRDAGFAYVRCKDLERDFFSVRRRLRANRARERLNAARERLAEADVTTLSQDDLELRTRGNRRSRSARTARGVAWARRRVGARRLRRAHETRGFLACARDLGPGLDPCAIRRRAARWRAGPRGAFLTKCVLFSFQQLTASVHRLQPANSIVELVGAAQVFVGVALLGLFGFTLANRLRNS